MAGSLDGVNLKIERARGHLNAIDETLEAFVKTAFEGCAPYCDVETQERGLKLGPLRYPDPSLVLVVGDFLHNVRSAFDHLAYQLVQFPTENGGSKTAEDKIAFPITDSPEAFERSKWKIRGAAPDVEAIVERYQPYHTWERPFLWYLHELNNWDKHRLLHLVENTLTQVGFIEVQALSIARGRPAGPFEADAELARWKVKDGLDPEMDVGFYMATEVAFEDGPAAGWQLHGTLESMLIEFDYAFGELVPFVAV